MDDDTLTELANAWPHLEELVLDFAQGQHTSGITFKGLASLLRACSLLHTLVFSIDATQLSSAPLTSPEEVAYNNRIETLYLEDSIIKDPAAAALILQDIFWSFKNVAVSFTNPHNKSRYDPLWAEVNSRLLLAATRKQEIGLS